MQIAADQPYGSGWVVLLFVDSLVIHCADIGRGQMYSEKKNRWRINNASNFSVVFFVINE